MSSIHALSVLIVRRSGADIEISAFLSGLRNPEHEALLRLIGASILDPRGAEADDEPAAGNSGREGRMRS